MTPTEEQQAIIDAYRTGRNLVIEAGAGTGKTTTLKMLGTDKPGRKGIYIAYNKAIARRKTQLPRRRPVRHRALLRLRGRRAHVPAPPQRATCSRRADRRDPRHHQPAHSRRRRDPRTTADCTPGDGDRPAVLPVRRPGAVRLPRPEQTRPRHPRMPGHAPRGAAAARSESMGRPHQHGRATPVRPRRLPEGLAAVGPAAARRLCPPGRGPGRQPGHRRHRREPSHTPSSSR